MHTACSTPECYCRSVAWIGWWAPFTMDSNWPIYFRSLRWGFFDLDGFGEQPESWSTWMREGLCCWKFGRFGCSWFGVYRCHLWTSLGQTEELNWRACLELVLPARTMPTFSISWLTCVGHSHRETLSLPALFIYRYDMLNTSYSFCAPRLSA